MEGVSLLPSSRGGYIMAGKRRVIYKPWVRGRKCYRGDKSVDVVLEREEAINLAQALLGVAIAVRKALDQGAPVGPPIEIAIYDGKKRKKDDTFTITVTSLE